LSRSCFTHGARGAVRLHDGPARQHRVRNSTSCASTHFCCSRSSGARAVQSSSSTTTRKKRSSIFSSSVVTRTSARTQQHLTNNFIKDTWEHILSIVNLVHEQCIIHKDLKPVNFLFVMTRSSAHLGTVKHVAQGPRQGREEARQVCRRVVARLHPLQMSSRRSKSSKRKSSRSSTWRRHSGKWCQLSSDVLSSSCTMIAARRARLRARKNTI